MLIDNDVPLNAKSINPNDVVKKELDWTGAVGAKFSQNLLTDAPYSESMNFNDTINDILEPDYEPAWGGIKGFTKENIDLLDTQWNNGYYTLDDKGNVQATEKYKSAGGINQTKYLPSDPHVKMWLDMKSKGYTPDSIADITVKNAQQEYIDTKVDLFEYDENNIWGQSATSSFIGDFGSWLADPINSGGLMAEIAIFKGASGGILREGRQNILKLSKQVAKGSPAYKKKMEQLTMKYGQESLDEATKKIFELKNMGLSDIEIISVFKNKGVNMGGAFKFPNTSNVIMDSVRKNKLQELGSIAGASGLIGGIVEAGHQAGTFDWKTQVLPEYNKEKAIQDVKLSAGFGFVFAGVFNLVGNLLRKAPDGVIIGTGIELEEQAFKTANDIKNDIPVGGADEIEPLKPETPAEAQIEIDETYFTPEEIIETKALYSDVESWSKIEQCMINAEAR